ncbi:hypothetical protein LCGC14_2683010, partial [marine sediment metagenome]
SGDTCVLCKSHREWLAYDGHCYSLVEEEKLRAEIYNFVNGKQVKRFVSGQCKIEPYEATRAKVSDILDAALDICHVPFDSPYWNQISKIVADNGMLDLGITQWFFADVRVVAFSLAQDVLTDKKTPAQAVAEYARQVNEILSK